MQKNLYYRSTLKRSNVPQQLFYTLFRKFTSSTRFLLEVFIRKEFGERYFMFPLALWLSFLLSIFPFLLTGAIEFVSNLGNRRMMMRQGHDDTDSVIFPHYVTWYLYIAGFLFFCYKHRQANKRNPTAFDFKRFTLSSGKINPFFRSLNIPGFETNTRNIECFFEPAGFFIAGVLLAVIGQYLGYLLIFLSFCYCVNYNADYIEGDHFIMDKIDEIISNEELTRDFVDDMSEDETRGFRYRGSKPDNVDMRKKLIPLMMDDEETVTAK